MFKRMHGDIESFSLCDLKSAGLYRYAEHPSTEVLCFAYSFDDLPTHLWVPMDEIPESVYAFAAGKGVPRERFVIQNTVPADMRAHIEAGRELRFHNANFERRVLNGTAGQKLDFPHIAIEACICTAAKARAHGLPGSLEEACKALGTQLKDKAGSSVMLQLCRPRSGAEKRYTLADSSEKYAQLYLYCISDVDAEKGIDAAVPDLTPSEQKLWELDQLINDRGLRVDLSSIADIQFLIDEYKVELETLCLEWTGLRPGQRDKLAEWVRERGYPQLPDMTADSVLQATKDPVCPKDLKQVLRLYSTYGMKAVSKLQTMKEMACADERLHGMFLYHGASTGRWSSMGVQLQNLARGHIKDPEVAIELFKDRDLEWVKTLYPVDPMKVFSSCVRGMLIPASGHDLMALDLAGIESRLTAWVFDEAWKLRAFQERDNGTGPDLYRLAYSKLFSVPVDSVTKKQRDTVAKCLELALGFEGSVGAFATMAANFGIDLNEMAESIYDTLPDAVVTDAFRSWEWALRTDKTCDLEQKVYLVCAALVKMWRTQHPAHVHGWAQMKDAAIAAVKSPGTAYAIASKRVMFKTIGAWLYMRLPSGRRIAYYLPEVKVVRPTPPKGWTEVEGMWIKVDTEGRETGRRVADPPREVLTYMGVDTNTRRWMRVQTYGGRLTQNFAEGIARDLLVNGMFNLEEAGYPVIGSVHDEVICEPRADFGSLEEARQLFLKAPAWADGLPLNAEGFRAKRYRK